MTERLSVLWVLARKTGVPRGAADFGIRRTTTPFSNHVGLLVPLHLSVDVALIGSC